jgi:hypothetical protein
MKKEFEPKESFNTTRREKRELDRKLTFYLQNNPFLKHLYECHFSNDSKSRILYIITSNYQNDMQALIHTKSIDKICDVVLSYGLVGETDLKIIKRKYLIEKMFK